MINDPVMMGDDESGSGSASDITIPAMMLFKQNADPIKKELEKGTMVIVEMSWSVPIPDGRVELDLWTTVTDDEATVFQMMWMDAHKKLGGDDTIAFTPHYHIYDGVEAQCWQDDGSTSLCSTACTNEGRYCAMDPDNDLDYGISGANVVEESLRRLCIWDIYGYERNGSELFFQYVREFDECNNEHDFMIPKCINDAMIRADIDPEKVKNCVDTSGGTERKDENEKLQAQIIEGKRNGITEMRVAYINGEPIRAGTLNFDVIFKAVCAGYTHGTKPDICTKCADCSDSSANSEYNCVRDDYCSFEYDISAPTSSSFNFNPLFNGFIIIAAAISVAVFIVNRNKRAGDFSRGYDITDEQHELTYSILK